SLEEHSSELLAVHSKLRGSTITAATALPAGRRVTVLANQGVLGIAFFEATASIILLVLFLLFRRDNHSSYFRFWLGGWWCFTFSSFCELALLIRQLPGLNLASILGKAAALILFLISVVHCSVGSERRFLSAVPLFGLILAAVYYIERRGPRQVASLHWETSIFETVICLLAGWVMWRSQMARRSHGAQLLAGIFLLSGLHGLDRPLWPANPLFLLRVAFDHFLGVALGIAMVVVVLESARTRREEWDQAGLKRVEEAGLKTLVTLPLPGKKEPLGVIAVGSTRQGRFQADELSYLVNIANLLGLTLQNVNLFEQVTAVQRQWEYT